MKKLGLIIVVFVLGVVTTAQAQDSEAASHAVSISVPSINLVDIEDESGENAGTLTWTLNASDWVSEAGDFNTTLSNSETFYLQYTSVTNKNKTHRITAQLSSSNLPDALALQVKTGAAKAGSKKGKAGSGLSEFKSLSKASAVDIVSGIKTAYTGTAAKDGHALNYQLSIDPSDDSFGDIEADSYEVTVVYTITE